MTLLVTLGRDFKYSSLRIMMDLGLISLGVTITIHIYNYRENRSLMATWITRWEITEEGGYHFINVIYWFKFREI